MKRAIVAMLLALLPGALFAETVMLYARMQPVESHQAANVDQFIAVEDGVEDQFYNSGHIIFDAGVPETPTVAKASAVQTDGWAEQTAKSGGANYLLFVNLGFPTAATASSVPSTVSYRFMDLKTGSMLAEGSVDTRTAENDLKSKKPYELCFAIGQTIAKYVMTDWSP